MKIKIIFFLIIISLSSCLNKSKQNQTEVDDSSSMQQVELMADGKLRYLELKGSPYERGLAHGHALKKEIREVIDLFKNDIAETTQQDPDQFIEKFLKLTDYQTSVNKWLPELIKELEGIADGSGVDFETIFMHQLGDEYWFNTKDILAHSCSSFGVDKSEGHPSVTAQNMDIPTYYHGYQTVLKIYDQDSDKEMMFLTIPGHLGITGMNNKMISINCNTLMQLDYSKSGLPVTFMVRGVVNKSSQEEALKFVREVNHASGQNYIIGGPEKVYSLECSANDVENFRPFADANFTYHTNHPMRNADFSETYLKALEKNNKTTEEGLFTCQRIQSFQQRFNDTTVNIGIDDIKNVLQSRDHDGKDVVSNDYTYASVIYVLSENPTFLIAPGQPHQEPYITIGFD